MNGSLATLAANHGGVFTRAHALQCGYSDEDIYGLTHTGEWCRLRRGAFCAAHDLPDREEDRHVLQARAVMLSLGPRVALSHVSAALALGLPVWGVDLSRVHITRLDAGAGRGEGDVVHHVGVLSRDELIWADGLQVVNPTRAVLETACAAPFQSGVVTADGALHQGMTTPEQLADCLEFVRSWPGSRKASKVIPFADGRAETPGESLTRVVIHDQDLPVPELQAQIHDRTGRLVAEVDFLFKKQRVIAEFDGRLKYAGDAAESADTVYREKRREDRLRALGFVVVRISWADLQYPRYTANRIRQAFGTAAAA
ncbi:MAG: type IV toxin-antitoxin system AbiEi family antitoxin domain-containing protein [Streptosporangiales bacterium]